MSELLRQVPADSLITGWDFSTSGVKCLAFRTTGELVAEVRLPTDLYHGDPPEEGRFELSLLQLEGQARACTRMMADRLKELKQLENWRAGGISATHHTAGRVDGSLAQVRRAICWNDQTLATYHRRGLKRLGGQRRAQELIGGPWAIRYSLSHLVKDEEHLSEEDWKRTRWILQHGAAAAGFLTGNFSVVSVSAAASTGLMDLRRRRWSRGMLEALASPAYRKLVVKQLPKIIDQNEPVGRLSPGLAADAGIEPATAPLVFPTSDDQQAGLVGGGAVSDGQVAVILGTSAVVNSSSDKPPEKGSLDVMRLNWGPWLWMRCYTNGAGLINQLFGDAPDFAKLEQAASRVPAGCDGTSVLPFVLSEPSVGVPEPRVEWHPAEPSQAGVRYRAALEALAYLIALAVKEHERAGQNIQRITVSGGMARSSLMCRILASTLNRPLQRLESDEGPALGAAVTALAAAETHLRRAVDDPQPMTVAEAVSTMVRFRDSVEPEPELVPVYRDGLKQFRSLLKNRPTR
ncbi:MAG: hypothetical protein KDA79_19530 [Planctomycetaceae bacterium]|nr:hypothetical protein [Planctomycetaceae bacterium]